MSHSKMPICYSEEQDIEYAIRIIRIQETYKRPAAKRVTTNIIKFVEKLEISVHTLVASIVAMITRRRPRVSARNPQICDEIRMPVKWQLYFSNILGSQ